MSRAGFLGPLGTFSHQAAAKLATTTDELVPLADIDAVYDAVERGDVDTAVVALENSVEGYVVPSLDRLLYGSVVGFERLDLPIEFSVLVNPGSAPPYRVVVSHPHALAQCKNFIAGEALVTKASTSTAAACADLQSDEIALAPDICGDVYGLDVLARGVQDQSGALTSFLKIRRREESFGERAYSGTPTTIFSITPREIGAGVLARITNSLSSYGVNIQSLITRPVKNVPSAYTFILTVEASPSTAPLREVMDQLLAAGDILKVLAIYSWPARDSSDAAATDGATILAGAPPESCVGSDEEAAISHALFIPMDEAAANGANA